MTKAMELETIRTNIEGLTWQLRNFSPTSKKSERHIEEAIDLSDAIQVEIMLASAEEGG